MPKLSKLASIICVTATWLITLVSLISIGFFKSIASLESFGIISNYGFLKLYTVMFLGFAIVSSANTVLTLMYDKPTDERSMEQIIALVSLDIVQYALLTVN